MRLLRLILLVFILITHISTTEADCSRNMCQEEFFESAVDNFNFKDNRTFKQRFFTSLPGPVTNLKTYKPHDVVFFYTGNEANVELYVNATG